MCSLGRGNAGHCTVTLNVCVWWGWGIGSNGACSTLHQISVTPSATHNQIGPLWCWFPSGWACARPKPLWVSPRTSPVRLGVSPPAAPTPTGVFNQRFEALFPGAGALGCAVCFAPRHWSWFICARVWGCGVLPTTLPAPFSATLSLALSVYLCANVGVTGSASGQTACHVGPTLCWSWSRHGNASPLRRGCPSPPLIPVWMNVYFLFPWCRTSLLFDFLSVLVVRGGAVCLPMPPSWFSSISTS